MKREDTFYQAMLARDARFDGKFFVGVKTTGIYCRPICPAKPKRENVEFFANHVQAERAGYRPCLRCRPESAPRSPAWIGTSAVVQRAVRVLHNGNFGNFDEDQFADLFGVTARHLRRLFTQEIGKTPKQLWFENRLNLARKLLTETSLPLNEVALGAGFQSVRRFNDAFLERFKKKPSQIRRKPLAQDKGIVISLPYRPPFDFDSLIHFYQTHRLGSLEWFTPGKMHRVVEFGGEVGEIAISNLAENSCLQVEIDFPDTAALHAIISKVRGLFDLDSDPILVANSLELDPKVKLLLKKFPGIRLPSGWDGFEVAISTILGQLVSVERGRALVGDLVDLLGEEAQVGDRRVKLFPSPAKIAGSTLAGLKTTGMRKRTLRSFSQALLDKTISLEATQDVDEFVEKILALPGIGPWTAHYMALKVLRHTDAFPATDLILARALKIHPLATLGRMSPWRGYAAALFWRAYSAELSKTKSRSKK